MSEEEKIDVNLISQEAEQQFCKRLANIIINEFKQYYPTHKQYEDIKRILDKMKIETIMILIITEEGIALKLNNIRVNTIYTIEGLKAIIEILDKQQQLKKLGFTEQERYDINIRDAEKVEERVKKRFDK